MAVADVTSKIRGKLIIDAYNEWIKPKSKVLDVGCGNGVVSEILKSRFQMDLIGCDTLSYLIRTIPFVEMTSEDKLPFKRKQFDSVMFNDVLHHITYPHQEKLLLEAIRVGKRVLLFELKPTLTGTFSDWLINKIHYWKMRITFTYRSERGWHVLFNRLGLAYQTKYISSPWWYPFTHIAYRLEAKKC